MQEAQACELPVIASRIGGLPEGLVDGETGFLVPEKDSQTLSVRICQLLEDEALRARMGKAGRDFVLDRYDNKLLTSKLLGIYEEMMGK